MIAFLFLWQFETFAPSCVAAGKCTNGEYRVTFVIMHEMLARAGVAALAYVLAG